MSSTYPGVDSFSASLTLPTGGDKPTAQLFRVPSERLLDNDIHLRARVAAVETRATDLETLTTREANREVERALLRLRKLDVTVDDTAESMAAVSTGGDFGGDPSAATLLVKVDSTGVVLAHDDSFVDRGGVIASVTSAVADAASASDGSRIVAIGVGGKLAAYTDNAGGSWAASGNGIGGAVQFIIRDSFRSRFLCGGSGTGSVYRTLDPSGDWSSAASGFAAPLGLAILGPPNTGDIVCLGDSASGSGNEPRFSVSVDGGATFSTSGATPPANAADADEPGDLRGCYPVAGLQANVYHIMRCDSGARIRTNTSTTGLTWTASTTLTPPGTATFASRPRLLIDQRYGLFVIVAPLDNGATALYASRDFVTWTGPAAFRSLATPAFALAGGRLFCTRDGAIYASDSARY